MNKLHIITIINLLLFPFLAVALCQENNQKEKPLTGQEILLELKDFTGKMTPGIYALKIHENINQNPNTTPNPDLQLLIPYGINPKWSWKHKKFVYMFNGDIWLSDLHHNKAPLFPFPESESSSYQNAVGWGMDGSLLFMLRTTGWGSKVFIGPNYENASISTLKHGYKISFSTVGSRVYDVIPFKNSTQTGISEFGSDLDWGDVISTNNPTLSPDGSQLAVESFPSAFDSLNRKDSRIMIFSVDEKLPDSKEAKMKRIQEINSNYHASNLIPPFNGIGKYLINSPKASTELNPLWSPNGKWIAYTKVDLNRGYVVPKIASIDGTSHVSLITAQKELWGNFSASDQWLPVIPINEAVWLNNIKNKATSVEVWGNPHRIVQKWSRDGKYLWMMRGRDGIYVAKHENEKWMLRMAAESHGSEFGIKAVAFNDKRVAWIEDSGDRRKIQKIFITDINSQDHQVLKLPPAVHVTSMDW